ncbi:MAG TPA: ABC transporter permease [Acidimicrobiales bacterium]|nr:ABC transporter permease [Acidimicrobiales bacterium]
MADATSVASIEVHPRTTRPQGHYRLLGELRSEWTKIRSVRSTTWSLIATVLVIIGIGILGCSAVASHYSSAPNPNQDFTSISLLGVLFGQLAIGVLGVLVMSAEYSTGTIRATLSAIPNRPLVLLAKALVYGLLAFVVSELVTFAAFFIGQAILSTGAPHATLGQPGVLRAVIGSGLYLTVLGLLALGLAAIIRHTAGSITAFVGILLIPPLILQAFPMSWRHAVLRYLPAIIGGNMTSTVRETGFPVFSPWVGLGVLGVYAAVALVVGGVLFTRRDA